MPSPDPACTATQHGDRTAYTRHGCRCPQARDAQARYERARAANLNHLVADQRIDATGTRRRIHALYAIGWRETDLSTRLGYHGRPIPWMHRRRLRNVYTSTARKVAALYDELSGTEGPSKRVRSLARTRGHVPPLGWDDIDNPNAEPITDAPHVDEPDPVVVDRLLKGRLNARDVDRVDRDEAIRHLAARGHSTNHIARHLDTAHHVIAKARGRKGRAA